MIYAQVDDRVRKQSGLVIDDVIQSIGDESVEGLTFARTTEMIRHREQGLETLKLKVSRVMCKVEFDDSSDAQDVPQSQLALLQPPETAPAPAPAPAAETPRDIATALADLVVQVDEASAVASPFSELLLKVAQVVRLVEGVRDGKSDPFSDAEWILITSLDGYFRKGMPPLRKGSTLRQFLATLLNRVPKALTQKFAAEEMELGKQTFEPQDVDLAKAVRTFRDQVAEFVASQRDRPYHGVEEVKSRPKNPWRARVAVPTEHRKVRDEMERVDLGYFATKKAAACAIDAFIEDDYRFDAKYVREKSNRIKYREDFATMDDEMKAAAEVGRLAATKEAPAPAPAATGDPMTDD